MKSTNIVYRETDRRTLGAKHRELARSSPDKFLKPGQLRGAVLITSSYLQGRDKGIRRYMIKDGFVGIDVAKSSMEVTVHEANEHWTYANNEYGLSKLAAKMKRLSPRLIVMESTGGYDINIAAELQSRGFAVAVVNPKHIRDFARSVGILAKTDILDAIVIARYAATIQPPARALPPEETKQLGDVLMRRRQIIGMLTAEKNRSYQASSVVSARIKEHILWLEKELDEINHELK